MLRRDALLELSEEKPLQLILADEATRLTEDRSQGTQREFGVQRNRENLLRAVLGHASQLGVAAAD